MLTPSLGLVVWTSVIFLTVLFILSKYAWKPIVQALDEREKFIEESLSSALKAKAEMAQLKSDNENLLQQARIERDRILKDAQVTANSLISEAKDKATVEADKMIANARTQIIAEKNSAVTELKNLVASTSVQIAEQILKKSLASDKDQKALVDEYLKDTQFN
jgi:F-type H+-transporting ATPase subunit b